MTNGHFLQAKILFNFAKKLLVESTICRVCSKETIRGLIRFYIKKKVHSLIEYTF